MLQLERIRYQRDITIRLRGKEPLFNQQFRRALAVALTFHLLGILIFTVKTFEATVEMPLPPIIVEADLGATESTEEGATLAQTSDDGFLPRYIIEPATTTPQFPTLSLRPIDRKLVHIKGLQLPGHHFDWIERQPYLPSTANFTFVKHYDPVRIRVSGQLAVKTILDDGLSILNPELKRNDPLELHSTKFHVQVENKTGTVFWFVQLTSSDNWELDQLAERIIRNMHFEKDRQQFSVDGEIEVTFHLSPSDSYQYLLSADTLVEDYKADAEDVALTPRR